MASSARELVQAHEEAWRGAVSHKFLEECKAGTVGENQFDAWLVQVRCHGSAWVCWVQRRTRDGGGAAAGTAAATHCLPPAVR